MAEQNETADLAQVADDDVDNPNYKAPAQKSLKEIEELDKDDESLVKYKAALLGKAGGEPFPGNPKNVIVAKMIFCSDNRPEIEMDLTVAKPDMTCVVKEGTQYRLKIVFYVQREIVSGLKFNLKSYRNAIRVASESHMVGSYGPSAEPHVYTTPVDELPSGMMARGKYKMNGTFIDDDKNKHLEWTFHLEIKKDWE